MTAYRTLCTAVSLWDFNGQTGRLICSDLGYLFTRLNISFRLYVDKEEQQRKSKRPASRLGFLLKICHGSKDTHLEGTRYYLTLSLFCSS